MRQDPPPQPPFRPPQLPFRHGPVLVVACVPPGRQGAEDPIFPAFDAGFVDAGPQDRGALLQVLVDVSLGTAVFTALAGCGGGGADGAVKALRAVRKEGKGSFEGTHC